MGIGQHIDTTDSHVEAVDLLRNRVPYEVGITLVLTLYSALKKYSRLSKPKACDRVL
jgi:hypothetical protein